MVHFLIFNNNDVLTGNILSSKLSSPRQQDHLEQLQQYEHVVPYLLDGDHREQSSNLHGKVGIFIFPVSHMAKRPMPYAS